MYCLTSYASPIGLLTLGSDGKHLTGLWIQGQKYFGGENVGEIGKEQGPEPAVFGDARKWLDRYFPDKSRVRMSFPWHRRERNSRS